MPFSFEVGAIILWNKQKTTCDGGFHRNLKEVIPMETKTSTRARVISLVVIALFAAAAVLSAMFMNTVAINYNLADYLGADTQTKIALDIIDEEFGMTGSIQVMVRNVTPDRAEELADEIEALPNVLNVNFDKYDTAYYKEDNIN